MFQQIKNNTKVILSSEFFSGFEIGQIQELRCDLDNMGAVEYEIILYIREPASYYLSFVQQQIKASSKFTPPTKFRYPFLKFITSWSKVFLREQLNIRIFNPEMFPEGSVLLDFQNCVEKFFKQKIELDSTSRDNESISAEGMIVLQKYREFIYPHEDNVFKGDSNILIKLLQKSKDKVLQTQPKLLPKVTAYIRQRHQKDVNALKNIILNSDKIDKKKSIAYFCGDYISSNLDIELKNEGFQIDKIINYTSEKITDLNEENNKIIKNHPPDIIFIYSKRSAESFIEIVKKYSLNGLMTESRVLCISEKVLRVFKNSGWKKLEVFQPGEELEKLKV